MSSGLSWTVFLLMGSLLMVAIMLWRRFRKRSPMEIKGDGSFSQSIVGTHHYGKHLASFGNLGRRGRRRVQVTLQLQRYNRHDPNAVAVIVGNRVSGHLSREDAVAFRARYRGRGRLFKCSASIAMFDADGMALGIKLDIPPLQQEIQ